VGIVIKLNFVIHHSSDYIVNIFNLSLHHRISHIFRQDLRFTVFYGL